ncbi:MAG: VCBS repeat-containing protein [Polyangiaceae bacterium]|nr:VCBS repeat-containing protein [Polyangiaceae bacterium]
MASLMACVDLPLIDADTCGNRVVEPGEDCDEQANCGRAGTPEACRLLCSAAIECPGGYDCGLDGLCRRPTGAFEGLVARTSSTTTDMTAGDINADGCAEIVRTGRRGTISITAFDGRVSNTCGASEQRLVTSRPALGQVLPSPLLIQLAGYDAGAAAPLGLVTPGDGPLGSGVLVYLPGSAPAFSPVLFPSFEYDFPAERGLPVRASGADALLLFSESGEIQLITDAQSGPAAAGALGGPLADVVALAAGDLVPGAGGACDEIAVARRGAPEIRLYGLCQPDGATAFAPLPSADVLLAGGARVRDRNASLLIADHNGDGARDLVTIAGDDPAEVHVAYGLGDGRFDSHDPPAASPDQHTSAIALPSPAPLNRDTWIVTGDFDSTAPGEEIHLVQCPGAQEFSSPLCDPIPGGCEAVVADFNADGYLDIAVAEEQQADLALYRGGPEGVGAPIFLETQCPPHDLTAGDIDGDGVTDLAFSDQAPSPTGPITTVSVAFGNAFAAPDAAAPLGLFKGAAGLAAGRFLPGAPGAQILAARREESGIAAALIEGLSERLLRAPFYFQDGSQLRATAAGRLLGGEGAAQQPAMAAITDGGQLVLVTPDVSAGDLREAGGAAQIPGDCVGCVLAPLRIASSDRDDLLLLIDGQACAYEASEGGLTPLGDCWNTEHTFRSTEDTSPPKYVPRPIVADLDGDGRDDVVARDVERSLVALWGRADGGFDEAVLAAAPECEEASCPGLSMALLNADADADKEIAVVGPEQLALYDIDRAARALVLKRDLTDPALFDDLSDFVAISAADMDGDGVDDLAVMPSSSFYYVLRGVPEIE